MNNVPHIIKTTGTMKQRQLTFQSAVMAVPGERYEFKGEKGYVFGRTGRPAIYRMG